MGASSPQAKVHLTDALLLGLVLKIVKIGDAAVAAGTKAVYRYPRTNPKSKVRWCEFYCKQGCRCLSLLLSRFDASIADEQFEWFSRVGCSRSARVVVVATP